MDKGNIINLLVAAVISSSVINGIVTHALYSRKLKKEQRMKSGSMIGEKITSALLEVRELELELNVIEEYEERHIESYDAFKENTIYPAIMNNAQTLISFSDKIDEIRRNYERFLDNEVALYLLFMDRYISQLMMYCAQFHNELLFPALGTLFIGDLCKWQKKFDKVLVRKINKASYKMEVQRGAKWKLLRKLIFERQWEKTLLYALIYDVCKNKKKIESYNYIKWEIEEIRKHPDKFYAGV